MGNELNKYFSILISHQTLWDKHDISYIIQSELICLKPSWEKSELGVYWVI